MVGIEVRQDEQVEVDDPDAGEASRQRSRIGARVDEGDAVGRADEDGVALPDVAREDRPVRTGGSAGRQGP